MQKFPKRYRGHNHETIGSDILSLLDAILMPEQVLGKDLTQRLRAIQPTEWYPISTLLEPLELLDRRLGSDSIRKVGIALFKLSHEANVRRSASSARDIIYGLDGLYRAANRGADIGGWAVLEFAPGRAVVEKTTPHHCVLEEGILEAALRTVNVTASIHQRACFRKGAEACEMVISSHIVDARWSGRSGGPDSAKARPGGPPSSRG